MASKTAWLSKRLDLEPGTSEKAAKQEVDNLRDLSHGHVVRFLGSFERGLKFGIVMYPVAQYHLGKYMRMVSETMNDQPAAFPDLCRTLRAFISSLCHALHYLHGLYITYKDIKPANILVDRFDNVLLTDFGISKRFLATEDYATTKSDLQQTDMYAAPETLTPWEVYSLQLKADTLSLGCVLLEMATVFAGESLDSGFYQHVGRIITEGAWRSSRPRVVYANAIPEARDWLTHLRPSVQTAGANPGDLLPLNVVHYRLDGEALDLIYDMNSETPETRPSLGRLFNHFKEPSKPCRYCAKPASRASEKCHGHMH